MDSGQGKSSDFRFSQAVDGVESNRQESANRRRIDEQSSSFLSEMWNKSLRCADRPDVTAPAVVAAVQAYSKINTAGQWVDRSEHVDLNALFEKTTAQELEAYAQNGTLPAWFTGTVGATARDVQKE